MDTIKGSRSGQSTSDDASLIDACTCDRNSVVTFYCEPHNEVICETCKTLKHRNCKIDTVKDKSAGYLETNLRSLVQRTNELKIRNDNVIENRKAYMELVASMEDHIKTEINNFRKEINQILDCLERETCNKLERIVKQESKEFTDDISTCTMIDKMIKGDIDLLEKVMQTKKIERLFAADVKVSSRLKSYRVSLEAVLDKNVKPNRLFEKNLSLIQELRKLKNFGHITVRNSKEANSCDQSPKIDRKDKKEFKTSFLKQKPPHPCNIKYPKQDKTPDITGCAFMPDGQVVLCDHTNYAVITLSCSFSYIDTMMFTQQPYDISGMNNNVAIVTCPNEKQLQYIEFAPRLKKSMVVKLDKKCWGIEIANQLVYITCHDYIKVGKRDGEVRILDLDGNLIRKLGVKPNGSFRFCWPFYIAVNPRSAKVFVSDCWKGILTCMDADGAVVYKSKGHGLNSVGGICVDDEDNIIVCDRNSSKVDIWTNSGIYYYSMFTPTDGIRSPQSIAYRQNDSVLIIGSGSSEYVYTKYINA